MDAVTNIKKAYLDHTAQSDADSINQVRNAAKLVQGSPQAFETVLDLLILHFDALTHEERQEALVILILSQKKVDDVSISLQDILTTLLTIKNHTGASTKTISAITDYEEKCDLDLVLMCGLQRYNQDRQENPVSLNIDWVDVVTHQAQDAGEIKNRIVRHFDAINRDADKNLFRPSAHLLATLIALILKQNASIMIGNIHVVMRQLKEHPLAPYAMKQVLIDYQEICDFDVLLANAVVQYQNSSKNPGQIVVKANNTKKLQNNWVIMDGYLSWKNWGKLSQTSKYLNGEFQKRMASNLSKRGQAVMENNSFDKRAALVAAFPKPVNRTDKQILINKNGIHYIQKDLGINCGPNTLIDIKTGRLSVGQAKKRYEAPNPLWRNQFIFLDDAQFFVIQKYCIDGFLSADTLIMCSQNHVINLANVVMPSKRQFYLDQMVLETNQPVLITDTYGFLGALNLKEIQTQLKKGALLTTQLLKFTRACLPVLRHAEVRKLLGNNLIIIDQILQLSQLDFTKLQLLLDTTFLKFELTSFIKLNHRSQFLVCDTQTPAMGNLMQNNLELVNQTLSDIRLSNPIIIRFIFDRKLPLETLIKLSNSDMDRLCNSTSLQGFFSVTNDVSIGEFFNLPAVNQDFLESFWMVLIERVKEGEITWAQIKNSTPVALDIFHSEGLNSYIEFVVQGYADWFVV